MRQFIALLFIHHENDVGPSDNLNRNNFFSVGRKSCRRNMVIIATAENLFSGRAAPPIATANEKNILQKTPNLIFAQKLIVE